MKPTLLTIVDAEQVVIELTKINWELLDLTYRFEWDEAEWGKRKSNEPEEAFRARTDMVNQWNEKKNKQYLLSIARRIKYESLLGRVLAKGHIGKVSFRAVYDMEPEAGLDLNYEVLSTRPEGEVRINEETILVVKESSRNW